MDAYSSDIGKDDIKFAEIWRTIKAYKYGIVAIIVLFFIVSVLYAYLAPSIYYASTKVEISPNKNHGKIGAEDVLAMIMDGGSVNVDTEIEIVQSYSLVKKALKSVNLTHHYYTTRKFKEVELYKNAPFEVGMLRGHGIKFDLIPISYTEYRLVVDGAKDKDGKKWFYNKVHQYEEEVISKKFHLNILRKKEMKDNRYSFVVDTIEDAGRKAQENISVNQKSNKTSILTISYTDNVPLRTQEFVNALAEAYVQRSIEEKTKEAELKLSFINRQLKIIIDNLNSSASKIEEFKRDENAVNLTEKAKEIMKKLSTYEEQLAEIVIKEKILNNLYSEIKSGKNIESISVTDLSNAYSGQTPLTTMIENLQKAVTLKKRLSSDFTGVHPEIRRVNKEISSLKEIIGSTISNLNKNILQKKRLLQNSIQKQKKYLKTLPANERVFGELKRKFEVNSKVYSYLLKKQSETAMLKESTISQINIIDRAFFPKKPIKPKRILIILIGLLLGILFGLLYAFLRAYLDNKIQTERDLKQITQIPLLGLIPKIKEKNKENILKVFVAPRSAVSEGFRNLRTNLQFMPISSESHIIAVTSTVGGEGKSTVAVNLAAIMSIVEKKTIVINFDMRKPTLHFKLGVLNTKGISSYLSGQSALEDVILETKYDNFDVITSGPIPPNPGELIQSERVSVLLQELRELYDVIILDTPPVGLVSDARILMRFANTILYVARSNYTKKSFLRYIKKLSKEEIRKMGIVFNDINIQEDGFGYGYGYYEE